MNFFDFASTTRGFILIACVAGAIALFLVYLIVSGGKFKASKDGVSFEPGDIGKRKNKNNMIAGRNMSEVNLEILKAIINSEIHTFVTKRDDITENYNEMIENSNEKSIERIVNKLMLEFSNSIDINVNGSLDKIDIYELYLTRDLSKQVLSQLFNLYSDKDLLTIKDIELNNKIESLVRDIINNLKLKVRGYKFLSEYSTALTELYDKTSRDVLTILQEAVKDYIRFSTAKTEEIHAAIEERQQNINTRIESAFNKDSKKDLERKEDAQYAGDDERSK